MNLSMYKKHAMFCRQNIPDKEWKEMRIILLTRESEIPSTSRSF